MLRVHKVEVGVVVREFGSGFARTLHLSGYNTLFDETRG